MSCLLLFLLLHCVSAQVPSLDNLASAWQSVIVCDDDAPVLKACGSNPFNHSHTLTFLMALDQGCCYKSSGSATIGGFAYMPNTLRPQSSQLASVGFYGADQAVPSLSNGIGALHADWRGDLLGITCFSAPPVAGPCEGWPGYTATTSMPSNVMLGGRPIQLLGNMDFRWSTYELTRRVQIGKGVEVMTSVRMPRGMSLVLFDLKVSSLHGKTDFLGSLTMDLTAYARRYDYNKWADPGSPANNDKFDATQFSTELQTVDGIRIVVIRDKISSTISAVAMDTTGAPMSLSIQDTNGTIAQVTSQNISTSANDSLWRVGIVWSIGTDAIEEVVRIAKAFKSSFDEAHGAWESWWQDAFDPNSKTFAGNFPTLTTDDRQLHRLYYASLLSMLNVGHHMHSHLEFVAIQPVAAQSSLYMWDTGYVATTWTLLDPDGFMYSLETLLKGLGANSSAPGLLNHSSVDVLSGKGQGKWYSFNDYAFVLAVDAYARLQGPSAALQKTIAGIPLAKFMQMAATDWRRLRAPGYQWLASYGTNDDILEVSPNYAYIAPSLNFANAWMMETVAEYMEKFSGFADGSIPAELHEWSKHVINASLGLYSGDGVWACLWPDGKKVVRHILDFVSISHDIGRKLPQEVRNGMLKFATDELRSAGWMRALSLQDAMASWPSTHRDDHGPFGAWDGWVAKAIEAFGLLGDWHSALDIAHEASFATLEGPFGQSHHLFMPNNTWLGSRPAFHKSGDWLPGEYFALCGGMFADVMITTLFGLRPARAETSQLPALLYPDEPRGFNGTLSGIRVRGNLYTIASTSVGLTISAEDAPLAGPIQNLWV